MQLSGDACIESGNSSVQPEQVLAEEVETAEELLEQDALQLNIAQLLEEDLLGELLDDGQLLLNEVELLGLAGASSLLDEDLVEGSVEVVDSSEEVEESISLLAEDGLVVQESGEVNPSIDNIDRPSRYGVFTLGVVGNRGTRGITSESHEKDGDQVERTSEQHCCKKKKGKKDEGRR